MRTPKHGGTIIMLQLVTLASLLALTCVAGDAIGKASAALASVTLATLIAWRS